MRVFSAKRLALLAFALLALLALGAAQGGAELELAEIDDAELDALLSDAEALGLDTGDDVGAVARAIERLVVDPELRRRMGVAGRRRVEEEFDQDHLATRLATAIDEVDLHGAVGDATARSGE